MHTYKHTYIHTYARLRRQFSFVLQQALSSRTRHHLCRQGVALASTRRSHSQGPASVQAHHTGGVTGSEGQKGANGVGGEIGVRGGNGDGNGDVDGQGNGDGSGAGTGVEANEGAQDGNGDWSGDGAGTGTGTGVGICRRTPDGNGDGNGDRSEDCSGDGNGDDDNGNENGIGEGGREAKKRKKPQNSCRRPPWEDQCEWHRMTRMTGPDCAVMCNLINIHTYIHTQGTLSLSKNCTSRESVSPLSRLIRGFRNKYH